MFFAHTPPLPGERFGSEAAFPGLEEGFMEPAPAIYWPMQKQNHVQGHETASNAAHWRYVHT